MLITVFNRLEPTKSGEATTFSSSGMSFPYLSFNFFCILASVKFEKKMIMSGRYKFQKIFNEIANTAAQYEKLKFHHHQIIQIRYRNIRKQD